MSSELFFVCTAEKVKRAAGNPDVQHGRQTTAQLIPNSNLNQPFVKLPFPTPASGLQTLSIFVT